jgi:ribonucleoside-diphosphate reductase alpha chain
MISGETGYRNAQMTVLAPTGTISIVMDCDTTGVEPMLGLRMLKVLAGGGTMIMKPALAVGWHWRSWGTTTRPATSIEAFVEKNDRIPLVGEPGFGCGLPTESAKIFQTSLGADSIPWEAHVKMMAAVQPFISGAISKTINMPRECTIDDVKKAYRMGNDMGLKSLAVYRDGCKLSQP